MYWLLEPPSFYSFYFRIPIFLSEIAYFIHTHHIVGVEKSSLILKMVSEFDLPLFVVLPIFIVPIGGVLILQWHLKRVKKPKNRRKGSYDLEQNLNIPPITVNNIAEAGSDSKNTTRHNNIGYGAFKPNGESSNSHPTSNLLQSAKGILEISSSDKRNCLILKQRMQKAKLLKASRKGNTASKAIQKAISAELLFKAQDLEGAITVYSEVCSLLQSKITTRKADDKSKRELEDAVCLKETLDIHFHADIACFSEEYLYYSDLSDREEASASP